MHYMPCCYLLFTANSFVFEIFKSNNNLMRREREAAIKRVFKHQLQFPGLKLKNILIPPLKNAIFPRPVVYKSQTFCLLWMENEDNFECLYHHFGFWGLFDKSLACKNMIYYIFFRNFNLVFAKIKMYMWFYSYLVHLILFLYAK